MKTSSNHAAQSFKGNDRLLYGIIFGVLAFWLFAQTTLNIAPVMAADLGVETNIMNIAVSITALFSGIFSWFSVISRIGGVVSKLSDWGLSLVLPDLYWLV